MTRLRQMMLEELERRNYSASTTRCYIRTVEDFALFFQEDAVSKQALLVAMGYVLSG